MDSNLVGTRTGETIPILHVLWVWQPTTAANYPRLLCNWNEKFIFIVLHNQALCFSGKITFILFLTLNQLPIFYGQIFQGNKQNVYVIQNTLILDKPVA